MNCCQKKKIFFSFQYDLPFVEVYRAKEFIFRANETKFSQSTTSIESSAGIMDSSIASSALSVWNCDGEVIDAPSVKIR